MSEAGIRLCVYAGQASIGIPGIAKTYTTLPRLPPVLFIPTYYLFYVYSSGGRKEEKDFCKYRHAQWWYSALLSPSFTVRPRLPAFPLLHA